MTPLPSQRSTSISGLAGAIVFLTAASLALAGCASRHSPPQQVEAQNPHVAYKYRGDEELLRANEKAATFCSQYRAVPHTMDIRNSSDGSKTVTFDCLASAPSTVTTTPFNTGLAYPYQNDQDLLEASRNADSYCLNNGSQRAVATIVTNADGTKNVTFRCEP